MNHVEMMGTLAQAPEMRYTPSGLAILELQLAGTDHVIGSDNRMRELAWYHRATIFGTYAETLAEALDAGDKMYVIGRLNSRQWETDDGQKRSMVDVVANTTRLLGRASEDEVDRDAKGQPRLRNATNRVLLVGNLTRDAELRYTPDGDAVLNLGMAVNERYQSRGEEKERTAFVDATAWRELAERNAELGKGEGVIITGRLVTDSWEDQNGAKRFKTKIEAASLVGTVKPGEKPQAKEPALEIDDSSLPF